MDKKTGILYILMEFCGGGDLLALIKQARLSNTYIPEETIWNYLLEMLLALNYCHDSKRDEGGCSGHRKGKQLVLHRDLKPGNSTS